jgi:hypothetical protein
MTDGDNVLSKTKSFVRVTCPTCKVITDALSDLYKYTGQTDTRFVFITYWI